MAKAPAEWDDGPFMDDMRVLPPSLTAKKKKRKGVRGNDGLLDDVAPSLAATAQVQADLLATASDLYRRIEADPHGLPEDEAYWTSLPAHLRTFIRNALPLGQLGAGANTNEAMPRHASTQAMIAVAQQLAQAAHASQNMLPDMYRDKDKFLPHFPGMTMPVGEDGDLVFVNELDDDDGDLDPAYASEENTDERFDDVSEPEKKKKSKKKKKKAPMPADERLPATSPPTAGLRQRTMPPVPMSVPHPPLPSSRATGKLPMMFHSATRAATGARPPMPRRTKSSLSVGSGHTPMFPMHMAGAAPPGGGSILTISNDDEREQVREFWHTLSRRDRQSMVRAEEQEVLRKLKEYQRHACPCLACLRKRTTVAVKLQDLYTLYFEALEEQVGEYAHSGSSASLGPGPFPGSIALDSHGGVVGANLLLSRPSLRERRKRSLTTYPPGTPGSDRRELPDMDEIYDDEEYDDEYDDEFDDEPLEDDYPDEYERSERRRRDDSHCQGGDCYCINSTLTVKSILTLADELGGSEAHKLILMMEQLGERDASEDNTACDVADDESNPSEQELSPDEQREQGWRMFQIFAARTLEQRVLQAYRERLAQDRQLQLLRELEEEESNEKAKEAKRAKENQRKKDKKRQVRQQKEEERLRREQKAAEEAAAREADLKRKEELRRKEAQKREAERKEVERREAERREAERKEAEKREAARKEAERKEAEKREAARKEAEKRAAEKREAERKEAERRLAEKEERRKRQQERRQRGKKAETEATPPSSQPPQLPSLPVQPAPPSLPPQPQLAPPVSRSATLETDTAAPGADLLFAEPFARAPFASRSVESDAWDAAPVRPPLPPQSTSRSLPTGDTPTASHSGSPSLHAPFFDNVASTTTALGRMQLGHPSPPHATPARDFGLSSLVAPGATATATASPVRAVPPPIGPIERPRRTRTGSSDVVAEGVLGSAALGDDELIEPRGRRTAHAAPLSGASAFGAPGSSALPQPAAASSFYSPWTVPGYSSLGLGSLNVSSPAAAPLGSMNIPAAPISRASGSALEPGYASPWSSSWDRARHAFEQPVDLFTNESASTDLGALGSVAGHATSVRSRPGLGARTRPTPAFPYHSGPAPPFPTGP
ncbi:Stress response protein nst1 [Malassezia equina]|uniref:Stress response protein NST1 n=1 Tax=Malassezia equina TaxID=1381935 RepID=A0AAF0IZI8_9BASI|nr:Stress response protein nst1 [Malassezia equina]